MSDSMVQEILERIDAVGRVTAEGFQMMVAETIKLGAIQLWIGGVMLAIGLALLVTGMIAESRIQNEGAAAAVSIFGGLLMVVGLIVEGIGIFNTLAPVTSTLKSIL